MQRSDARCSDRLVGRTVLAEADGVVGHHEHRADAHQGGEADRRPAVVGEHQEGAAVGDHPAVQRHAVHRRRHGVLADPVVDVAAAPVVAPEHALGLDLGVVRSRQVGRTAEQFRQRRGDRLQRALRGDPRRDLRRVRGQRRLERLHRVGQRRRQLAGDHPLELGADRRIGRLQPSEPVLAVDRATVAERQPGGADRRRDLERRRAASRAPRGPPRSPWRRAARRGCRRCRPWSGRRSRWWSGRRSATAARRRPPRPAPPTAPPGRGRRPPPRASRRSGSGPARRRRSTGWSARRSRSRCRPTARSAARARDARPARPPRG